VQKTFDQLGFKKGDVVKCINQRWDFYTVGKEYVLSGHHAYPASLCVNGKYSGYCGEWELVKSAKEDKQMSKWTSTKTEVVTKEVKTINKVVDGSLSNQAYVSIVPDWSGLVNIVVGAEYEDRLACSFSKKSLKELINVLTEVHDAMEDK